MSRRPQSAARSALRIRRADMNLASLDSGSIFKLKMFKRIGFAEILQAPRRRRQAKTFRGIPQEAEPTTEAGRGGKNPSCSTPNGGQTFVLQAIKREERPRNPRDRPHHAPSTERIARVRSAGVEKLRQLDKLKPQRVKVRQHGPGQGQRGEIGLPPIKREKQAAVTEFIIAQ